MSALRSILIHKPPLITKKRSFQIKRNERLHVLGLCLTNNQVDVSHDGMEGDLVKCFALWYMVFFVGLNVEF